MTKKYDELIRTVMEDINSTLTSLHAVIRGEASPCACCLGCEVEHGDVGICKSFLPRTPPTYRVLKS